MGSLMPWTGITSVKQELDQLFDGFGEPTGQESSALGHWAPSLDVSETKDAFVVKYSTAGMEASDIELSLRENVLTIRGERKREKEDTGRAHRVERSHSRSSAASDFRRLWTRAR